MLVEEGHPEKERMYDFFLCFACQRFDNRKTRNKSEIHIPITLLYVSPPFPRGTLLVLGDDLMRGGREA